MNDVVDIRGPADLPTARTTMTTARHDDARESALTTDLLESREVIGSRLAPVRRRHPSRRTLAVAGHGAAAVALAVLVATTVLGRPVTQAPPVPLVPAPVASAPAASLRSEITGAWSTSMSRADIERTLAAAGLADYTGRVVRVLGLEVDPGLAGYRFQAYVGPGRLWLYRVRVDGTERLLDEHAFDLDDDVLTGRDGRVGAPPHVLVLQVALDSPSMRLAWIADAGPAVVGGIPAEAVERVLYTTSTWMRSTT